MSKQYDDFKKKFDDQNILIENLVKKVEDITNKSINKDKTIADLSDRVNDLEQMNLGMNIEIHNLQPVINEELRTTLKRLAEKIQAPSFNDSVLDVYRRHVNTSTISRQGVPGVVVMKMSSVEARSLWLERKRLYEATSGNIRVYEMLTPTNRKLLWQARTAAKAINYKFTWVKGGKIFVKENENSGTLRIINEADILKKIPNSEVALSIIKK
jgi:hypothetical protein